MFAAMTASGSTMNTTSSVTIYTDGSILLPNPGGVGGWGFVVLNGFHDPVLGVNPLTPIVHMAQGGIPVSTNNISEMTAVLEALRWAKTQLVDQVLIVTDSQYVINGMTQWMDTWKAYNWTASSTGIAVVNADLWRAMDAAQSGLSVRYTHVRGHQGNRFNDTADWLAGHAARTLRASLHGTPPDHKPQPFWCHLCGDRAKLVRGAGWMEARCRGKTCGGHYPIDMETFTKDQGQYLWV